MTGITRREAAIGGLVASLATLLPHAAAQAATKAATTTPDPLAIVDRELRAFAAQMIKFVGEPMNDGKLTQVRGALASFTPKPLTTVPVSKRTVKHLKGGPDVTLYVINAKPGSARPAILHMHGGGYYSGSAESNVRFLQEIAVAVDCVIVTVEYRLAPEVRYTGSLEDNYTGLRWLYDNAAQLSVDPKRIAVMGESAGGGHAALLAQTARDRGEVPLIFQCLVYPMLDDRIGTSRMLQGPVGTMIWTPDSNRYGWKSFLGREPGGPQASSGVPARAASLAGLPPAWIGVGSIDLFVVEDTEYATRLIQSGVPAELLVVPGAFHGFDVIAAQTSIAKRFATARNEALIRALHRA